MAKTVVGLFDSYQDAQGAVDALVSSGFDRSSINILASNATQEFHESDGTVAHKSGSVLGGMTKGAVEGATIGGLTGFAASVALFLIPGVGPVLGAGTLAATLGGAGLGAIGGGVIGGLSRLGIPETEAGYYAEGIRRGGTLVSLTVDDNRADEAVAILDRYNPVDIDERSEYYKSSGYTGYTESAPHYTPEQITTERASYATASVAPRMPAATTTTMPSSTTVNSGETMTVPIVEEQLTVGKREVQRGGARVHTHVVETPVSEQVSLREEHVTVERHAVNRPVSGSDLNNAFQEGTIELTERAEEAVVGKTARVVEEVTIGKEASERTETVTGTVRRTDVDVQEIDTTTTITGTTRNL